MRWLSRLRFILPALFARKRLARDLDDEMSFHVEMMTQDNIRRGLPPEKARRAALVTFGGVDRYNEETRDMRGIAVLEQFAQDLRVSLRLLRKSPQFTFAALFTLALGIGANTAIFSVVNTVLLRASPFANPDKLVMVWETDRSSKTSHEPASWPDVMDLRERSRTISSFASMVATPGTLTGTGDPERVSILAVTPNMPDLLGVKPLIGRTFRGPEGAPNGAQFALLGEEYWRRRFNSDRSVLGQSIVINDVPTTILGVLPADADLGIRQIHSKADYSSPLAGPEVELWLASESTPQSTPRSTHPFLTIGRLANNATLPTAQAELARIMSEIERAFPDNHARGVNLELYDFVTFGPVRPALLVLLGAVALVLLIACVNVANLLLARTAVRSREVAVRRALGAATGRITRQFLVESLVLTGAGALAGILLARVGLNLLVAVAPTDIPRLSAVSIDVPVLAFTALVAGAVAIGFGMTPALIVRRMDLQSVLKAQSGRGGTEGGEARRFRGALVVAEVALAVTLVIGAGVLLRSFWKLASVDPGFRATSITKVEYQLPATRYPFRTPDWPNIPVVNNFHAEVLRRVRALPGVQSAALAARHPLDPGFTNSFQIVGREAESQHFPEIRTRFISPGYLETMGVTLVSGRAPAETDVATTTPVGVINRATADAYFKGRDPIGQQIRFWGHAWQIIGVIGDEHFKGLAQASEPAIYPPIAQAPQPSAVLLIRSTKKTDALLTSVRKVFQDLDPQIALYGVEPLERTVSESIAKARFTALLLGLFGALAIILALIGVHGVLSYTVAQRGREVGIRMALGATRSNVIQLVVGEGARLAALGTVIGLAGALAGSQLLAGLVFGVTPRDLTTFVAVTVGVLSLAGFACWIPARRAARADPMRSLRTD